MFAEMVMAAQLECMTEALYFEARSEGFSGMVAVAAVIYNRSLDDRWPDTPCLVIEQPLQFSYRNSEIATGRLMMPNEKARQLAEDAAYAVLSTNGGPLMGNVLYYHADYVSPNWDYSKIQMVGSVGAHEFYVDRG
jgi:spore germination cell wall hydrolase CwlJ-like protein